MTIAHTDKPLVKQPKITLDKYLIENARIELIYQTFPTHMFTAVSVSFLIVFVMWSTNSKLILLSWMAIVILMSVIRLWHSKLFNKKSYTATQSLRPWAWIAIAHISLSGIMWGAVPLLFLHGSSDSLSQIIVAYFFSTFIMVGQSVTYCSYRPMWFAYALPASTLMTGNLIMYQQQDSAIWSVAIILTMVFCLISLQNNSRTMEEAIKLKLQYGELMKQLQREKDKADQANQSKSIFLASASHDLRQPVHSMNLFIEILQKKQLPEQAKELVGRISNCAKSLHTLFNSLLDISNLDAGTIEHKPKLVNLNGLINSLVALHTPEAEHNNLILVSDSEEIKIHTDPMIIRRILSNLISNAIYHSDTGEITVSAKTRNGLVRISVIDTGRGIPVDMQQQIFEEFSQLQNPERDRAKGLGLGLSICSRLVKLLGSEIHLRSTPSKGANFYFDLAMTDSYHEDQNTDEHAYKAVNLSKLHILIIDDELEIREAMHVFLKDLGCRLIITASDTDESIRKIKQTAVPDLIISDYRLRKHLKGIDVIETIRQQFGEDIKAILVTGDTSPKSLSIFNESNIVTLHKPVDTRALLNTINKLFAN